MGLEDGPTGGHIPEPVQDRYALGGAQHHVERGHGIAAVGAAEELGSVWMAALEHGLESGHGCFALQPKAAGAGAVPRPGDSPWPDRYSWWSVASSRV
jgi:hypothetical protein